LLDIFTRREYGDLDTAGASDVNTAEQITFMQFWAAVNSLLRSHGLPEMLYGEARGYWQDARA
jgi:hypothetical protein